LHRCGNKAPAAAGVISSTAVTCAYAGAVRNDPRPASPRAREARPVRTGAATGHEGYFHEALYYSSDDELLAVLVPFLLGGAAAGEPTIVALGERNAALVRSALPAGAPVRYAAGGAVYARPAAAIRSYRTLLAGHVAEGAAQIRIIGELPAAAFGATWDSWMRYESAINHAYDDFPLWSMCAYDRRTTPEAMLHDVARTHPRTARPDGSHPVSEAYTEPVANLSEPRAMIIDPVQRTAPAAELTDPGPALARRVVRAADPGSVPPAEVEDLVVAVSEAVTNAMLYGRPPVLMRVWPGGDRLVVTVSDGGAGPKDPFAGLLPAPDSDSAIGGRGLWISHQSVNHVSTERSADGYSIRMVAGNPG
jgi:anti-sigma regulatory factor (Ser/Thr protein kinase)